MIAYIYRKYSWCFGNIKHSIRKLKMVEVREVDLSMVVSVAVKERE